MNDSVNHPNQEDHVPKRGRFFIRCLFGLAWLAMLLVLFYAEENWRGARALESYKRQLAAKGETLDWKAFVPPAVPDSENFAMTPFLAPLFDFIPGTQTWRDINARNETMSVAENLPTIPFEGGWRVGHRINLAAWGKEPRTKRKGRTAEIDQTSTPDRAKAASEILDALAEYGAVIEELRTASQRSHSRFNIRYDNDDPAGILLPHLGFIKRVCQILTARSAAHLAIGQAEPAFNDVMLMFRLVDASKSEPFLISHLVRVAGLQMTMQAIWEGFIGRQWSDVQLRALQARLGEFNLLEDLKRSLEAERAEANRTIDQVRVRRDLERVSHDFASGGVDSGIDWVREPAVVYKVCPAGWYYFEQLNYNRMFDEWIMTGFNAPDRRVYAKRCEDNGRQINVAFTGALIAKHRVFARLLLPALSGTIKKIALAQNAVDEAIVACALERFRLSNAQYPESLDALAPQFISKLPHDIINGERLKYRRAEDGKFVLYSVGWNEVDDGGVIARTEGSPNKVQDIAQGDWVWPLPAK
jgi:hypothetical protein